MKTNIFIALLEDIRVQSWAIEVSISGSYSFLLEANEICNSLNQYRVSYYPSCGNDVSDLNLFYDDAAKEELEADVFLRSDYFSEELVINSGFYNCISNRFIIKDHVRIEFAKRKELELNTPVINIYKLEEKEGEKIKYVIHLGGVYNEKVLALLLKNEVKTKILHTKCDGIWWGEGINYNRVIPTYLFPLFQEELQLSYILSDHNNEEIISKIMDSTLVNNETKRKDSLAKIIHAAGLSTRLRKRLGIVANFQKKACEIIETFKETRLPLGGYYLKKLQHI